MKRILSLLLLVLLSGNLFAQKNNRSTLRIRLSDDTPLTVSVNGRYFQKTGRSITLGDLPKKRHNIKVYRFRAYQDGNGGKAELVYSGRIKVEPGTTYDCVVDVNARKFRMKPVGSLSAERNQGSSVNGRNNGTDIALPPSQTVNRSAAITQLKTNIDAKGEDAEKLKIANAYLNRQKVSVNEAKDIASWFYFDDTRLSFVKAAYGKVSDPNNFSQLGEVFTLDSSFKDFQKFLEQK